jgi:LysR family transcriptional regulator (chromosome initiation inhibitor)
VVPLLQVRSLLDKGHLVQLLPQCSLPVALFWHQWKLGPEGEAPTGRVAMLDAVGAALEVGAHEALEQPGTKRRTRARPKG